MQAMALAFREASKEIEKYKNPKNKQPHLAWVATKVTRVDGQNPSPQGLGEFFKKVDADQDWFPGRHTGAKRGPAPIFTPVKRRAVAECAMKIKQRGDEPTAEEVVQRCKVSTTNPDTGKPFDFKLIRQVFATDCYDFFPECPWRFQARHQRTFLPDDLKGERLHMCCWLQGRPRYTEDWVYENVVWVDPCFSILPGSFKQFLKQKQLAKGEKGWISDGARTYSRNLRGPIYAAKQRGWEGRKQNWVAAGQQHVPPLLVVRYSCSFVSSFNSVRADALFCVATILAFSVWPPFWPVPNASRTNKNMESKVST